MPASIASRGEAERELAALEADLAGRDAVDPEQRPRHLACARSPSARRARATSPGRTVKLTS